MIDLDKLAELEDLWRGSAPGVTGARCLNVRHQARDCRICVEACPVEAISIPNRASGGAEAIVLDQAACARCGLCLNVCPTGVFVQPEPPESRLGQVVARSPGQVIELACPRKEPPDLSQVPGASVVQTPRCLGALAVPALLELTTAGLSLWLNDSICHSCPIGKAHGIIQRNVASANRWLEVMGGAPAIRSYLTNAEELADTPTSRPVIHQDHSVMSRRDFFRSLTGRKEPAAAGAIAPSGAGRSDEPAPSPSPGTHAEGGVGQRPPHFIPAQRQHLARALRRLGSDPEACVPTADLPIADVRITDACSACGLCARFCPSEAITFLSDGAYYVLHFSAALCLGEECSLCSIGCPTDAVRFGQEVTADELLSTQPRAARAGRLAPCPQCGALTHAPNEGDEPAEVPLCYVCQAQAQRSSLLPSVPTG